MKKLVYIVLFLPIIIIAQTQTENYVKTTTYKVKTATPISNATKEQASKSIQYFDGLGRMKQSIVVEGGGIVRKKNDAQYDWTMNNMGSTDFYNQNGSTSENSIINGTTPFGDTDLLWECKPDSSINPDGGWFTDYIDIDQTKTYRYSVWVKKDVNLNDGSTSIGTQNVLNLSGSAQNNPFFWDGDLPELNKWYLVIGLIHPANYNGGNIGVSGVYDVNGHKVLNGVEFKWDSNYSQSRFKSYLWGADNTNTRQYFWSPLIQQIDGSELSLNDLVNTSEVVLDDNFSAKSIITHYEYDQFGRQAKEYLPYASNSNDGNIRQGDVSLATKDYYLTNYKGDFEGVSLTSNVNAYSEKTLESSPLNRVFEQGAPGKDWEIKSTNVIAKNYSTGHTIKFDYNTNTTNEVKIYSVTTVETNSNDVITYEPTLDGGTSSYTIGELSKTITKDENWNQAQQNSKDHTTEEFKNKQGQVILKRTYNNNDAHDTFYVYDDFGNLTYVIPPKAEGNVDKPNSTELSELCYQYKYDARNRLVEKKIPGKGWEYIIYDAIDRPVITQDNNLRNQGKWLFTSYDRFGRVAYTGKVDRTSWSRETMQNHINTGSYNPNIQQYFSSPDINGVTIHYPKNFLNSTYIPESAIEVLTINYYNTYLDLPTSLTTTLTTSYGITSTSNTKGLATVSKVRVLGTSNWITTVTYYDDKARPIYLYSKNDYLNTVDIVESKLDDFTGKVLETKTVHTKTDDNDIIINEIETIDRFEYDHMDRLISQSQQINDQVSERIVKNNYDELGQLESKVVGSGTKSGYTDVTSGISISGNTITKTGSDGWNEGLATQGVIYGDGYVDFKTEGISKYYMAGLSDSNPNASSSSIDYAIYIRYNDEVYIYESGSSKGVQTTYTVGDIFRVERIGDKIYYKKNNETFYISQTTSSGKLLGDISMYHTSAKIKDFKIVDNENGLQKVDYDYNVRGWLKKINDTENLGTDLFSFDINYNQQETAANNFDNLYNGNISQTIWKTANDNQLRGYSYRYDALNRILQGYSLKTESLMSEGPHSIWGLNYDKNGNIGRLTRNNKISGSTTNIDELYYTYSHNQLLKVDDLSTFQYKSEGFKDGTNSGNDYSYDVNGNMTKDENKGILDIDYNHLNLPTTVTLDTNVGNIEYIYDATGVKQKKKVFSYANGWTTSTIYAGNYTYIDEDDGDGEKLQFFNHLEGYVKHVNENNLSLGFDYVYQYKDHLGNVRLSYTDNTKSYENIIDSDFEESFDGWKQNGSVNYTLEDGRLKANVMTSWEGIRYDFTDFTVNTGEVYNFNIKFDKANTQSIVRFYIKEFDANNNLLRYVGLNWNIQTGEYSYGYTVGSNTKYITIHLDKDNQNLSSETQFYVDYITFTKGSLDIIEESNYYPFGLKHKGYNDVKILGAGNPLAQNWKYNGVEYNESLGLNLYEMDLRQYDPAIGRWTSIDPITHWSMSTYTAFDNNPIFWADPSGADSWTYVSDGIYRNDQTGEESDDWQKAISETQSHFGESSKSPKFTVNINNPQGIKGPHLSIQGEVTWGVQFKEGQKFLGFGEKIDAGVYKVLGKAELLWSVKTGFILNVQIPGSIEGFLKQDHIAKLGYNELAFGAEQSGTIDASGKVSLTEGGGNIGPFNLKLDGSSNSNVGIEIYSGSHTINMLSFSGSISVENVNMEMRKGTPADGMELSKTARDSYLRRLQHSRVDKENKKWIMVGRTLRALRKI